MEFSYYSLPAVAALILKILLLLATRVMPLRNAESKVFLAFLFVLALHNVSEVMMLNYAGPQDGIIPLRSGFLYYTMSIVAMAVLVHLMLVRINSSTHWTVPVEQLKKWIYLPAAVVLVMLWTTEDMVKGFVPHGYSFTRVPGPLYVWFETYALGYLLASFAILSLAAMYSSNRVHRRKNVITLLGMTPIIALPVAVIVLQKNGINVFNLLLSFPLALTFFLIITAYAIYEHRLFNIFFHLPGTRLHRRRTAFHRRIAEFIGELDRLPSISVEEALNKLAEALKCNVALVGAGRGRVEARPASRGAERLDFNRLREEELGGITEIVLTKELRERDPSIYSTLKGANCAAVIPFHPFKDTSAGWLLLGGAKDASEELPIDFSIVESLFDRMGDLFLETIVREREQMYALKMELEQQKTCNEQLTEELSRKQGTIDSLYNLHAAECAESIPRVRLEDLTGELEKKVICETLAQLKGNVSATAKSLGLTRQTLYAKMENYGIESDKWRKSRRRRRTAGPSKA